MLGRPVETVRGWLRRFEQQAEHVRVYFTMLLVDTGPDPVPPAASRQLRAVGFWSIEYRAQRPWVRLDLTCRTSETTAQVTTAKMAPP
ncbi:hypothetical protein OG250_18180 [Streptomyces sp. NBC_00487]|uniref:hypothetical protein n=1 Tax=unclassified Streptomyces TaxID=2593676 RepID=UPI002DD94E2C|nr:MULTISPECIES: hypothetical protein [unclassified Streptomyces]WRY96632.1 hypothetical protein OG889_18900 [Streptomyces sp. NBC_00481]